MSDEARAYVAGFNLPVYWYCFSLSELVAFVDKCGEQIYSNLADAFHDRNMQLIVKMLASMRKDNGKDEEIEEGGFCQTPRAAYDDYLEDYLSVVSELNKIYFIIHEIYSFYSSDMIRVVFFYG